MNSDMLHTEEQPQSEEIAQPDFSKQKSINVGIEMLPIVDRLFIDEDVPENIAREISSHLLQDEFIFVLFQLNSPYSFNKEPEKMEKVPLWTMVTGTRLLLLAISSEGETYCDIFDQHTVFEYQDGLARDEIRIADRFFAYRCRADLSCQILPAYSLHCHQDLLYSLAVSHRHQHNVSPSCECVVLFYHDLFF